MRRCGDGVRAMTRAGRAPDRSVRPSAPLLQLQAMAGNRAVARLLAAGAPVAQREAAGTAGTRPRRTQLTSPRFVGDATLEACLQDRARLGEGAVGASVGKVQQALVDHGSDLGPAGADQKYGAKTAAAVRSFKAEQKLGFTQFGDVGPGTMDRLDELFPGPLPVCDRGDIPVVASGGGGDVAAAAPREADNKAAGAPLVGFKIPGIHCNIGPQPAPPKPLAFAKVRAPGTPAKMPDRIPPRVETPVEVTIPASTTPTTIRSVPTATSGEPGQVVINGKPTADITASGTVSVRGTVQTTSRFFSQLSLVAEQGGKEVGRSDPFAVAALPTAVDMSKQSDSGKGSDLRGMIVAFTVRSDSGDRTDLDQVQSQELLLNLENTGCFAALDAQKTLDAEAPGYGLGIDKDRTDRHRVRGTLLNAPGVWRISQVMQYRDLRTGAGDIPIPSSGFAITWSVGPFASGAPGLLFVLTKAGIDSSAKGVSSGAGNGAAFTVQEV